MRAIPATIANLWNQGGPFIGDTAVHGRVTVEPDWTLATEGDILTADPAKLPFRWWQRIDNSQTEVEVPNIKSISIDRSLDADAQQCSIVIYNQKMAPNTDQGIVNQLGMPGYYTWKYGERDAATRWGQEPNEWNNILIPNALIRTYQGYGGREKTVGQALTDGNLILTGVWLIDDVRVGTDGMLTLGCRDMAKLLIEQQLFPPLMSSSRYPLNYYRWEYNPITYPGAPVYNFLNPIESGPGNEGPKFVRDIAMSADGKGYWIVGTDGGVFSFGVPFYGSRGSAEAIDAAPMAAMAADPLNHGYWLAAEDGGVFTFGEVGFYGSATASSPDTITGMAAHPNGRGYWLVDITGSVYSFGSAQYYGGDPVGATEITAIEATPTGNGYWLLSTEGAVYTFGDAEYFGGPNPVGVGDAATAIASTPSGNGYYIATVMGQVHVYGDAVSRTSNGPFTVGELEDWVFEMTVTPTGNGYILVAGNGAVYTFGDAPFWGNLLTDFTYTQKLNGNYLDYVDIIKDLVRWSGWLAYGDGSDDVYGALESTGAYSEDPLDKSLFDKRPVIDAINGIKEIVGYHVWVDEEGGFHFESPNWYQYGNILDTTAQRVESLYNIDEQYVLTDYMVSFNDNAIRSELIISSHDPTAALSSTVTSREQINETTQPSMAPLLRGMVRPAMWVNGHLTKESEQLRMITRIMDHVKYSLRQGTVTCVANPAIQINDQVRIYERQTGETFVHYVKGIQTEMDLDAGTWTSTLTTFWLGEDWIVPEQPAIPAPGETGTLPQPAPAPPPPETPPPSSENPPTVPGPTEPPVTGTQLWSRGLISTTYAYPNDGFTSLGFTERTPFSALGIAERDEARLSYTFTPWASWNPDPGGKIPGLGGKAYGITQFSGGGFYDERSFSARLMWKGFNLVTYLYVKSVGGASLPVNPNNGRVYGFDFYATTTGNPSTGTRLTITPGVANTVQMRVVMNTPGISNGIFQVWLNGTLGINLNNVMYRTASRGALRINQLMLESFYGGPWANSSVQHATFNNFRLTA